MNEREIFDAALEIADPRERAAFLDQVCAGDALRRGRIAELLDAQQRLGSFLQSPPEEVAATIASEAAERPGAQIGPYKRLQPIGEGGMGVVYMAEQSEPVRRRVALKIIKPGMDTSQVIARFEAERQALALMDHPSIAKVLDAGATESGRPYFVMELVEGIPLTQYCDERHFTPNQRLALFVQVCQAVQHAHQKGIIHRDIKPSNILVTEYDRMAVPKVIDFGVAKATSQQLTEKTMFTQYGQIVGTLEYMSPEQAELNQWDIDTRSDVYSLGVLLYELLVGVTPFDRQRLRSAAFEEMLRIIREEEPPKPSIRLSTIDTLRAVATHRRTEPQKLSILVRGELDWIVMKALEKDRARRYETANAFATDIQHYLEDEPVVACPPSAGYRFRKFAKRNKVMLATSGIIAAALVLGLIGTASQWLRAESALTKTEEQRNLALQAEQRATQERDNAELAKQEAERQRNNARGLLYVSDLSVAFDAAKVGNLRLAEYLLERHRPDVAGNRESFAWSLLNRRIESSQPAGSFVADEPIIHGALSPDESTVAIAGATSGEVVLWDINTQTPQARLYPDRFRHQRLEFTWESVSGVEFSYDGTKIAVVYGDRSISIWDITSGDESNTTQLIQCQLVAK